VAWRGDKHVKNVQISFDEDLLATIDDLAASSQLSRSAVVREALKTWIRRKQAKDFEDAWITRLKESPPEPSEDDAWLEAETWSEE
jgi:Arc/MetJ-type ribon-helix-helix transcriptional regulator